MNTTYLDIHIHTSEDPNVINHSYDLDKLVTKINEFTGNSEFLISLTDHNTINKTIYLKAVEKGINILIGVELHIKNYDDCPAYHCHIYFNIDDINEEILDDLNQKLDELYPNKIVNKLDVNIPKIEKIINTFDSYEFLLLPHGGQSHCTFDTSIPVGIKFDSTMERSIYYNQFDGFTARGNTGLERTQDYFKKLGINDFVNLVTCTDNYNPIHYPNAKVADAKPFIPTWMFALPTFNGLRLSLSESSRLVYSESKPKMWSENIKKVTHKKSNIDIDIELTSGLNVVIGGSSSGKTLLVDSIYKSITNNFIDTNYSFYEIDKINVENPSGITPHYLSQNYIMTIVNNTTDNKIDSIDIIKNVFPGDDDIRDKIDGGLRKLKQDIKDLVKCIKIIEDEDKNLKKIQKLSRLLIKNDIQGNLLEKLLLSDRDKQKIEYSEQKYLEHNSTLDEIDKLLANNPFINHNPDLVFELKNEIEKVFESSVFESKIRKIIIEEKTKYDTDLKSSNLEEQTKKQTFDSLIESIKKYVLSTRKFYKILEEISTYAIKFDSEEIISMGHTLYIENDFELNKEKFLDVINHYLKSGDKINHFRDISPEKLFESNFKQQLPKVHSYDDFELKVYNDFEGFNKKKYKITTSDGREFENLSAGWKTSVILDIILGYDKDIAPVIIDQPEDNLATTYINKGLVEAIKKIKTKKQIILVSHNATIPMLADAQNIVLCNNVENKIIIRSSRLEGKIDGKNVLDYIAEITDGGKPSIKKRVKKYNLKKFKE